MSVIKNGSGAWIERYQGYHVVTVQGNAHQVFILQDDEPRDGDVWCWAKCDSCDFYSINFYTGDCRTRAIEEAEAHIKLVRIENAGLEVP